MSTTGLDTFPLRIDRGLRSRLDRLASHDGRKVSELARDLLRSAVEDRLQTLVALGESPPLPKRPPPLEACHRPIRSKTLKDPAGHRLDVPPNSPGEDQRSRSASAEDSIPTT
jgi:hypothetical protein